MSTDPTSPEPASDERDAQAEHVADRAPTPDEERRADESAADVDPRSGEAYQESIERGAAVQGEGEIVPGEA